MEEMSRRQLEALTLLFDRYALNDQRDYYNYALGRNHTAAAQVNRIRAMFALLAGVASVLVGFFVTTWFDSNGLCGDDVQQRAAVSAAAQAGTEAESTASIIEGGELSTEAAARSAGLNCGVLRLILGIALVVTVVAPALGGAFTTLADLYQWDRLTTIYESALENIEVADSRSPNPNIPLQDLIRYRASMRAFAEGTLSVMRDETAQWGQSIRTPEQIDKFIRDEQQRLRDLNLYNPPESDSETGANVAADTGTVPVVRPSRPTTSTTTRRVTGPTSPGTAMPDDSAPDSDTPDDEPLRPED